MIMRFLSLLAIAWGLGFAVFMLTLAQPADNARTTDAIVVPTGGAGRIVRGLTLIEQGRAKRMLVSGVATGLRKADLIAANGHAAAITCCVDLGREAVDTRSNAEETARWVRERRYRSVRLVTSDWHMARARMELGAALDRDVAIMRDGVRGDQRLGPLVNEYNKLILRRVALWLGLGR
ncbi:YdcF family protein [Sphingomonas radiodurans]|uniref:YdcF family protein n=1 Tax=Sphingomonas radiodurans TaxID=2890321 RepID=UPI001E2E8677|nr:YdcF family protein [Sphingomonas radiodurans]WBH17405.1 YdcF family protein [Sphingomonas radiodurans]